MFISSEKLTEMPNQIRDLSSVDAEHFAYIFEQNVSIPLKSSTGLVRCNVYRPKAVKKAPVLVTYGPYGSKSIRHEAEESGDVNLNRGYSLCRFPCQIILRAES